MLSLYVGIGNACLSHITLALVLSLLHVCHTAVIAGHQPHWTRQVSVTLLLLPTTINVDDCIDLPCAWLLAYLAL